MSRYINGTLRGTVIVHCMLYSVQRQLVCDTEQKSAIVNVYNQEGGIYGVITQHGVQAAWLGKREGGRVI